jgi:protein-serine/threonine kinase
MITDPEVRLGRNGADEIKAHPFFNGFDWTNLRKRKAPYQPKV